MKPYRNTDELVKQCLKHQSKAQRTLYDEHVGAMYNTVMRYTCNPHDTEDVLQIAFSKVFRQLATFDSAKGTLKAWIRRICVTSAIDFLRKKSLHFVSLDSAQLIVQDDFRIDEQMETEYILDFIQSLNPQQRAIFNMHVIEGYSHNEISEILDINADSSRVYLSRAKENLRKKIGQFQLRLKSI